MQIRVSAINSTKDNLLNSFLRFLADIIQRVFGYPSECNYRNNRMPCKLAFSCWLQGGKHAQGCGNHWLFSCCVAELKATSTSSFSLPTTTLNVPIPLTIVKQQQQQLPPRQKIKLKQSPPQVGINKNQILKRRLDDQQSPFKSQVPAACGVQPTMQNTLRKRIIGGRLAQFAEVSIEDPFNTRKLSRNDFLLVPMASTHSNCRVSMRGRFSVPKIRSHCCSLHPAGEY